MTRSPSTSRRPYAATGRSRLRGGFTLLELLIVVAIIALLAGLLLPALAGARESARAGACASNVRGLALAGDLYAFDHAERYAPAAANVRQNLHRWHGARARTADPFDASGGALAAYLDRASPASGRSVRACPTFLATLRELAETGRGFERSAGGYGYNRAFVGAVRSRSGSLWVLTTDEAGSRQSRFQSPDATIAFADAALATGPGDAVIEYSFAEARFWPDSPTFRADPSIHFRHGRTRAAAGRANIAWLDGHVAAAARTHTWSSGLYPGDPDAAAVGWTGEDDDNSLYDYE